MLVICAAVGEPADRRRAASDLNLLARELQIGAGVSFSWEETKRRAAKALCSAALTGKVVQGVPIVGVYGGFRVCFPFKRRHDAAPDSRICLW